MIKNLINEKRYIGQTIQDVEKRFLQHMNDAYDENRRRYTSCLSRSIRKHGRNNFIIGILADNVPKDDLDIVEAHYIDMYNTTNPNIGLNMSPGENDNSHSGGYYDIMSDQDYSDNPEVMIDNITDEDVDKFLKEI